MSLPFKAPTTQLRRRTWPKRRKPLRAVSPKRAARRGLRSLAVEVALLRDRRCVGLDLIPGHVCSGLPVGHEPLKRTAGGDPCNPDQVLTVCAGLNRDIEDRPWLYRDTPLWVSMGVRYENGRLVRRDP